MRLAFSVGVLTGLGLASAGAGPQAEESERPAVTAFFADGSSQPVRAWSLAYEYMTWPKGESPARGQTAVRETAELLLGKRALPLSGGVLEILYEGGRAQALVFTDRDGKKSRYKVEAPAPELLVPQLGKDRILQQRVLDLRGETLTGGRRSYCLLSYSTLVECATEPAERVVKIGFP